MKARILLLAVTLFGGTSGFSQTLKDSLVAHYPFNSNALDASGNGHNGTIYGATLTDDRFGNPNAAYEFNGVNAYIDCGSIIDVSSQTEISISAWFFLDNIQMDNNYAGVSFGKKTIGELTLRIREASNFKFQGLLIDGGSNWTDMTSNSVNYAQWYHVAGVYKDNDVKIYVDGVLQTTATSGGVGGLLSNLPSNIEFQIGRAFNTNNMEKLFHGKLDDIRIYNRALTGSEVDSLYNEHTSIFETKKALNKVIIFPNPSTDFTTIQIEEIRNKELTLNLTNLKGQKILQVNNIVTNQVKIGTRDLPTGLYFITLLENGFPINSMKLIIE